MNEIGSHMRGLVQKYNHRKYWKYREKVVGKNNKYPLLFKVFWLYYIKKCDAFNGATMGTHIGYGAEFKTRPNLPHGLNGIIVSHNAVIGENCTIFHQVTIGEGKGGSPIIGKNCFISAGAKITGKITIGDNVRIGTNCVVVEDVPDNCTVVMNKPRILRRAL